MKYAIKYDVHNDKLVLIEVEFNKQQGYSQTQRGYFSIPRTHRHADILIKQFNGTVMFHSAIATEIVFNKKRDAKNALEWLDAMELAEKLR